jgi:hypothetical protein
VVGLIVIFVIAYMSVSPKSLRVILRRNTLFKNDLNPEIDVSAAPIDVAIASLKHAAGFFAKRREIAKGKAERVVITIALANGLIAVIGVAVTIAEEWSILGILSTALAALITGLTAWDTHYRHRELWTEKTVHLSQVQELLRDTQYRIARGKEQPDDIADDAMNRLRSILQQEMRDWMALREFAKREPDLDGSTVDDGR